MTETLKPREKRHQRTRKAILAEARKIIAQKGVDGLSLRGLARAIDYSPAGLYEYFDNKDDLICSVADEGHLRLKEFMARVDTSLDVESYLAALGQSYLEFAEKNPEHFLLMFTTLPQAVDPERERVMDDMMREESSFPILYGALQRGVDEGVFPVRDRFDVPEMALAAWFQMHGLAMLRLTMMKTVMTDFQQLSDVTMRNFIRGLTAAV